MEQNRKKNQEEEKEIDELRMKQRHKEIQQKGKQVKTKEKPRVN